MARIAAPAVTTTIVPIATGSPTSAIPSALPPPRASAIASTCCRTLNVRVPANSDDLPHWAASVNAALVYDGGYGYGVLPERMSASVEVRTLPGMRDGDVLEDIRGVLASVTV